MSLDFTSLKDTEGAAVYLLHDGNTSQQRELEKLADRLLDRRPPIHAILLSSRDSDGHKICEFYGLPSSSFPHIIAVRDNDEILHHWSGIQLPTAEVIAYTIGNMLPRG